MDRLCVHYEGKPAYDIVLGQSFDLLAQEAARLGTGKKKLCIVTDSNVAPLYLDEVAGKLKEVSAQTDVFVFPAGEEHKNLDTVRKLYETLVQKAYDRSDMLVALGGGVTGDLCGFGAATYLRGISFIQIPTTLLAQVDSSIGGKTGVDFDAYKNMVGAFHMPSLVYTNVSTLSTLDGEQFASGMGEVIKHGLIRDKAYYDWLACNRGGILRRDPDACQEMIFGSNKVKREVVEADPKEKGERALLNFGHTLGHAVEKLKGFSLPHGHCVALGCLAACRISAGRGYLSEEEFLGVKAVMEAFGLPLGTEGVFADQVFEAVRHDKKMEAGKVKFILLEKLGQAFIDKTVSQKEMLSGLSEILC